MGRTSKVFALLALAVAGAVASFAAYFVSGRENSSLGRQSSSRESYAPRPSRHAGAVVLTPEWAGLTKAQATKAAKKEAIRSNYRGDSRLFNLNLWSVQARPIILRGRTMWLVKFYDAQALKASCAYAWVRRGARTRHVRCAATSLGAGKPQ